MADNIPNLIPPDLAPKAATVGGVVAIIFTILKIFSIPRRVRRLEEESSILMRYAVASSKFMLACTKREKDEAREHFKDTVENMENYLTRPRR